MAAFLEWRCHITLTTRSSPQSVISVCQQSRRGRVPLTCWPLCGIDLCSGNRILVLHDSDSTQTLKTFSVLSDWLGACVRVHHASKAVLICAQCMPAYVWCCQEACDFGAASQSRRGAVSMADLCSWHSAKAETPTHVKWHSTNFFPMQPRYNRRGERPTHLIAPQNEIPRRLCNSQMYRLYFNAIHCILSSLFCA